MRKTWHLIRDVFELWSSQEAMSRGAAVAFYSIFSLTPLILMALLIAGIFVDADYARQQLLSQLRALVGGDAAELVQKTITAAGKSDGGPLAAILGAVTLFIGASGVFAELRSALDAIHHTRPNAGLSWFVRARLWSFALVLAVGFLLLVSLVISAFIASIGEWLTTRFPVFGVVTITLNALLSLALIAALFGMLMRWLPSERRPWRKVWKGAVLASVLMATGKEALGYYLGRAAFGDAYGAAGALVILTMWIYYSGQVFLIGAAFNEVSAGDGKKSAEQTAENHDK